MQDIINCGKWTSTQVLPFFETSGHILYGRGFFRLVLNLCSCAVPILIIFYFITRKKTSVRTRSFVLMIFIIGICNGIARYAFASNLPGAFYERDEYHSEKYEAYVYNASFENEDYTFCIATISHDKGLAVTFEGGLSCFLYDNYFLEKLELPYNRVCDELFTFYPDGKYGIAIKNIYPSFVLEVDDIATEDSYNILQNEILSTDGEIVASYKEDIYHHGDCEYVKKIDSESLVHFNSATEAEFYGYSICEECARK